MPFQTGKIVRTAQGTKMLGDCSSPYRARLPTSWAAADDMSDLRNPPWAETDSPSAFPLARGVSVQAVDQHTDRQLERKAYAQNQKIPDWNCFAAPACIPARVGEGLPGYSLKGSQR